MNVEGMTWQHVRDDSWDFGLMVNGIVRRPIAQIYFTEELNQPPGYGWVWLVLGGGRGVEGFLGSAADAAEEEMAKRGKVP